MAKDRILVGLAVVLLLGLSSLGLAQAASNTPQDYLPGDDAVGPAAGSQQAPAIAQGGDTLLAVWSDRRSNPTNAYEWETSADLYGMRLAPDGSPLDAEPIPVAQGPSSQDDPKIAWNGSAWLVVFEGVGVSGTGSYYQTWLQAVRVLPSGQVLDQQPINIYNARPPSSASWAVASDGNDWVIAYQGSASDNDLKAVRVNADGHLEQPAASLVPATYYLRTNLKLAYAAGVYLLTYNDNYVNALFTTKAVRFDDAFNVLDPSPRPLRDRPLADLTSNGSQFYIVWNQQLPDYTVALYGSRIDTSGTMLDGNGVDISGGNAAYSYPSPSVVWDQANWRAVWSTSAGVRVARIAGNGSVVNPGGTAVPGPSGGPAAATSTGGLQLVWSAQNANDYDVYSTNIASNDLAGPTIILSTGAPQQIRPDVAIGSSGYMVVYQSNTASGRRVMAHPLDAAGNPITPGPIELDSGDNSSGPGAPAVAWNGTHYLITWGTASGIVAQRLWPDGSLADPAPFPVMTPAFGATDVAAIGDTFLVTGRQFGYNIQIIFPVAARVAADGTVLDSTPLILGYSYARPPAVTVLDGRWFVAWHRNWTHDDNRADTKGTLVSLDGTFTPDAFNYGSFSTSGGNFVFEIGLASSGNTALLVQSQELTSGVETDLLARLIGADGSLQQAIDITPWRANQYAPRAAWDGARFILVYTDQRNRIADLEQMDARGDQYGMRISESGSVLDPQGFALAVTPIGETNPTVVAGKETALTAGALMRNQPFDAYRIGYQQWGMDGNHWPVAVATADKAGGDTPLSVSFSSAGSNDPDGSIASYAWTFGDGATSADANPSHTFTAPGNYVVMLTVTDNGGAQTTGTVFLQVTPPNQLPVAMISASPTSGPAPLDVIFYAAGSYDPDGAIGNIHWYFDDGGTYAGGTAYHTFTTPGLHTATVTVFDNRGDTGSATMTVNVEEPNATPIAMASADVTSGTPPLTVNFSSAGSNDPDGSIVSYAWTFGDGGASSDANPVHTYASTGNYVATLTVTDNRGATASDSVDISVGPNGCGGNCVRSASIDMSARAKRGVVTANATVLVVDQNDQTVRSAIVYATWTLPDGSIQNQIVYSNRRGQAKFSTSGGRGTYTLTVTNIIVAGYSFDEERSVLSNSVTA